MLRFSLSGARPGAVLCYRYKVRTTDLGSLHRWAMQGNYPILKSSFRLRLKKGTEIPVRIEGADPKLSPRYHVMAGAASSRTQVKAWAIWELDNVPPTPPNAEALSLVVGM